jgi:glucosyl-dolichyl phosphate glucuronosyltransferase
MVSTISILISTYNRAADLRDTLAGIAALRRPPECDVELVIVDNNSNDATRSVIERAAPDIGFSVVYEFEPRQGKSIALNRGLARARGDVIALTDDDVLPESDWLERIVAAFRAQELSFVFGKVLPRWGARPPSALMTKRGEEIWGPLALVDYGDAPVPYSADTFETERFPIGANLAISRRALEVVGGWRPDLGKVDNSMIAGEDFEIFFRLRDAGLYVGLYDPLNVVHHYVPAARLNRFYFRRWFFWHGRTMARMLPDVYPEVDFTHAPLVFGAPRFLYRQLAGQWTRWMVSLWTGDRLRRVVEEMYTYRLCGVLVECWSRRRDAARRRGVVTARRPTPTASTGPRFSMRRTQADHES